MVALLAAAPMRIANFAALRIGRHVLHRNGAWTVELAAEETKARRATTWPVPERLALYLAYHLDAVWPALLARGAKEAGDTGALWLGAYGQPLGHQGVRKRIKRRTAAAFGRPVLPHGFRNCAATTFALEHPQRPRDAAALLGHAGLRTTERHCILSRRHLALAEMQGIISRRIRAIRRPADAGAA
jgi:site-specific recombinase XerD